MDESIFDLIDDAGTIITLRPSVENTRKFEEIANKFESYLKNLNDETIDALTGPENKTLLQKLCDQNLDRFVAILFQNGTLETNCHRANAICSNGDSEFPLLKAAINGDVKILELLIKNGADISKAISKQNENVLHCILEKSCDDAELIEKYQGCLSLLLGITKLDEELDKKRRNQVEIIVNKRDRYGNTALYYASHKWPASITLALLNHGSKLSMNKDNDSVITSISPETLEEFLDSHCIKSNFHKKFEEGNLERDIHIGHSELEITFDYSFLARSLDSYILPEENVYLKYLCCVNATNEKSDNEYAPCNGKENDVEAVSMENDSLKANKVMTDEQLGVRMEDMDWPESEPLWHIAQSSDHCRLLKHPVITSFLSLKWIRIRQYYNRNLRFFAFFVFLLTRYILYGLDNRTQQEEIKSNCDINSAWFYAFNVLFLSAIGLFTVHDIWLDRVEESASTNEKGVFIRAIFKIGSLVVMIALCILGSYHEEVIKWSLFAMAILLAMREIFQFIVSIPRYLCSPENLMEVGLITMVFLLIFSDDPNIRRQSAAFAIILSWVELIILVGKHPASSR